MVQYVTATIAQMKTEIQQQTPTPMVQQIVQTTINNELNKVQHQMTKMAQETIRTEMTQIAQEATVADQVLITHIQNRVSELTEDTIKQVTHRFTTQIARKVQESIDDYQNQVTKTQHEYETAVTKSQTEQLGSHHQTLQHLNDTYPRTYTTNLNQMIKDHKQDISD